MTTNGVGWSSEEASDLVAPPLYLVLYMQGQELWRTKKYGGMKRPFVEPFIILGNGKDPTKTVYSCHTRKDQSHLLSLQTGSSGRDRDERY